MECFKELRPLHTRSRWLSELRTTYKSCAPKTIYFNKSTKRCTIGTTTKEDSNSQWWAINIDWIISQKDILRLNWFERTVNRCGRPCLNIGRVLSDYPKRTTGRSLIPNQSEMIYKLLYEKNVFVRMGQQIFQKCSITLKISHSSFYYCLPSIYLLLI